MRHVTFEVPSEIFGDFTEKLTELDLNNTILERNEDDEIVVQVNYEKDQAKQVDELESHLEELLETLEGTDEDEDED